MKAQRYQNHVKYYIPHHVFFYLFCGTLTVIGVLRIVQGVDRSLWIFLTALTVLIAWLSFMTRQHYALMLQDRLLLLEMRFHYFARTGQRFDLQEKQLSVKQIAALRFASDEEFDALLKRTIDEKLSPDAIKRAIKNWRADYMRV